MDSGAGRYPPELLESADALTKLVAQAQDFNETLQRLAELVVHAVDGAEGCSISLVRDRGKLENIAATSETARRLDELQDETGEGPCMSSIADHAAFYIPDMSLDEKWPTFSKRAAEDPGLNSVLSFVLRLPQGATGAMNMCSSEKDGFTASDHETAALFAAQVAVALATALEHSDADVQRVQLQEALKTRQMIGQAVGIVMASRRVDPDEAFEVLKRASQHANVKLREIAEQLVEKSQEPLN